MNDILKKKLASYSAATASLLAANHFSLEAQIIYTNIPDTSGLQIFTGESINSHYDLDLNNDGIFDFKLYAHILTDPYPYNTVDKYVKVKPVNNNAIEKAWASYAMPLDCGEIIGGQVNFYYSTLELIGKYISGEGSAATQYWGLWTDETMPHLLGLKLIVDSDTLYGWVRLKVENYEFEVHDYAYNSTPNQEIVACDISSLATSASILNEAQSSITAFVNGDNLTVIVSKNLFPNTLRIMNILGEPIVSKEIFNEKNEIDLSAFSPGIYLVTVGEGKSPLSKKIVLSR